MYTEKLFHLLGWSIVLLIVQQCSAMQQQTDDPKQIAATALILLSQRDVSTKKVYLKFVLSTEAQEYQKKLDPPHTKERPYRCTKCSMAFKRPEHLRRHVLIHTGEKPYICVECSKLFSRKDALDSHLCVHQNPYLRNLCQKAFNDRSSKDRSSVVRHEHTHTEKRLYTCTVCKKAFNRRSNLFRHKLIHTM